MQVLAYTGNEDGRKFVLEGEITLDSVRVCSLLTLEPNFWINRVTNSGCYFPMCQIRSNVFMNQLYILFSFEIKL